MNRFHVLPEFLGGVLDALEEDVLLEIKNLAEVILDGDDPLIDWRAVKNAEEEDEDSLEGGGSWERFGGE